MRGPLFVLKMEYEHLTPTQVINLTPVEKEILERLNNIENQLKREGL